MLWQRCVVVLVTFSTIALGQAINSRPVIGILALPDSSGQHNSYIAASYIKYLESGGAQVAPIQYTDSDSSFYSLLSQVNGFFFTGGDASFDPTGQYFHAVSLVYNYTLEANANGTYFPLWGTCLGFEAIIRCHSLDENILSSFDAENITLALSYTDSAKQSRVFSSSVPGAAEAFQMFGSKPIAMNNHVAGVAVDDFQNNDRLSSFFTNLATNVDRNGDEFVSMIEANNAPIWGSQFHPEKNTYEWYPKEVMQHTYESVFAANYLAQFFVDQTRKNTQTFSTAKARKKALIDNFSPTFTDGEFTQIYYFD